MVYRLNQRISAPLIVAMLTLLLIAMTISPAWASPLTISSVSANPITATWATITWDTDEEGSSTVNYGTSTSLGDSKSDSAMVLNHVINLNGLTAGTTYYCEVISTDALGNPTVDNNNGNYYMFDTPEGSRITGAVARLILEILRFDDSVLGRIVHLDDPEPVTPLGAANMSLVAEIAVRVVDAWAWFAQIILNNV